MELERLLSLCLASAPPTTPAGLVGAWSFAPQVVLALAVAAWGYARGWCALRRVPGAALPRWRALCFAAGWLLIAAALVSPLCRLAATLVAAHMVQHLILVALAPPLIVLGHPLSAFARALDPRSRLAAWLRLRRAPDARSRLAIGFGYGAAIWMWHYPPLYNAVLLDPMLHTAAYALLVGVSLWFWSVVLTAGTHARLRALPMLFGTLVHTGLLGALLTFASSPWYPVLARGAALWGLTPLEDQQLGGLIMWVPMSGVYLLAAIVMLTEALHTRPGAGSAAPRPHTTGADEPQPG